MKYKIVAAALAAVFPFVVQAQGLEEASVDLVFTTVSADDGSDTSWPQLSADLSYRFGGAFGLQLGADIARDTEGTGAFGPIEHEGLELHLFFDPTEQTRLGILIGTENFGADRNDILGIEAVYAPGPFRVEARLVDFESDTGDSGLQRDLLASASLSNSLDLIGSYSYITFDDFPDDSLTRFDLGVAFDASPNQRVFATIGRAENVFDGISAGQDEVLSIGYRYSFGAAPSTSRLFRYTGLR